MKINIIGMFEQTVDKCGDSIAVKEGNEEVTFAHLKVRSLAIASIIQNKINSTNKIVAVYLPKSIDAVAANLGISYSCNAYMNLDIGSPIQRIENILGHIKPSLILTSSEYCVTLKGLAYACEIVDITMLDVPEAVDQDRMRLLSLRSIDTDPYCVINTSGSTGTPKGVVLNHRSFLDFMSWSNENFVFNERTVIGSLSPLIFDIYSFELCLLVCNGCQIVLIPEVNAAFPVKIINQLKQTEVSFIFWVPTIMVNVANMKLLDDENLDSLKTVWFAGEVFPTKQFNYWRSKIPTAKFVNMYGPIEITLDCTFYVIEREILDSEPIPIGRACENTEVLILNDRDQLCANTEEGELCVRGTSLAMGYYNDAEKTNRAFVQNPLNAAYPEIIYRTGDIVRRNQYDEIVFVGRKDTLIKHLGYRIELSEIEHVLVNKLKLVKNGCVVYNGFKKRITCYYESSDTNDPNELKKELLKVLPKYMVPSSYICLESLPRNPNGKIDRNYLKLQAENL